MTQRDVLIQYLASAIAGGIVGTACITGFVYLILAGLRYPFRPLHAIGTIFVEGDRAARALGMLLHVTIGLAFALIYTLVLQLAELDTLWSYVVVGTALGVCHGFVLFFVLIPPLAEHHRSASTRSIGPAIALLLAFGHLPYGTGLGLSVGLISGMYGNL